RATCIGMMTWRYGVIHCMGAHTRHGRRTAGGRPEQPCRDRHAASGCQHGLPPSTSGVTGTWLDAATLKPWVLFNDRRWVGCVTALLSCAGMQWRCRTLSARKRAHAAEHQRPSSRRRASSWEEILLHRVCADSPIECLESGLHDDQGTKKLLSLRS